MRNWEDKMTFAFFLNSYNDIDNMVPVIWKFLEKNEDSIVIFGTNYDYRNDYRINYLQRKCGLKVFIFPAEYKRVSIRTLFRFLEYIFGYYNKYEKFLKDNDISACIFEWKVFYSSSLQNMFFGAAKKIKNPTIAIPHGVGINTNPVTDLYRESYSKKGKIQQLTYLSEVDIFVESSLPAQKIHVSYGLDPTICEIWGSARYYPEWAKINLEISPIFTPIKPDDGKVKVVFMLPRWGDTVDASGTITLINELVNLPWIYLVIKERTRGDGSLDKNFRNKLNSLRNVEASVSAHSSALIQWSDAVINIDSSIGIEAILQDKILISPAYLSNDKTIFEDTESAFKPCNNSELIKLLSEINSNKLKPISNKNKRLLLKEAVYGGKDEYDVLEYYWENISTIQNRINYKTKPLKHHIIKVYRSFVSRLKLKLPELRRLLKDNPIRSSKRVIKWVLKTYIQ